MWKGKAVAVVVPAFDEERRVGRVIARMPPWVDTIVVVDDASRDGTSRVAETTGDARVVVLRHDVNRGVGAAIETGYRRALRAGADVLAVMAGDDQMDPADLGALVDAVARGSAAYAKGNRFLHNERRRMPRSRRIAGKLLALVTRVTTGLAIDDSQCGYTAISRNALEALPLHELWPRYGYPNDLLGMLAAAKARVVDVPVRPVYAGEASGVRPWHAFVVLGILARRWARTRSFKSRLPARSFRPPSEARGEDRSIGRARRESAAP